MIINVANLAILSGGRKSNLNIRGAWLHVMADTLGSVGAMSAGAAIYFLGWRWADPVASPGLSKLRRSSACRNKGFIATFSGGHWS